MNRFFSFWRPHSEEKQPKKDDIGCDVARRFIYTVGVGGRLGMADRVALREHCSGCSKCSELLTQTRKEKEEKE